MNFRRSRRQVPELELTPLIDVVFQLLIFFLITTTFVSSPGMSIQRPKAKNGGLLDQQRLTIEIPKGHAGRVVFEGKPYSYLQLKDEMVKLYKQQPEAQIAIDADGGVSHWIIVKVMDVLSGVGFERIGIVTNPSTNDTNE